MAPAGTAGGSPGVPAPGARAANRVPSEIAEEGSRRGPGDLLQQWVEPGGLAGCRRSPAGVVPGRFQGSGAPGGLSELRRARPGTGSRGVPSRLLGGARLRGQRGFGEGSGWPGGPHAAATGWAGAGPGPEGPEGPEGVAGPALPAQIRRGGPGERRGSSRTDSPGPGERGKGWKLRWGSHLRGAERPRASAWLMDPEHGSRGWTVRAETAQICVYGALHKPWAWTLCSLCVEIAQPR